jgi:hypothetical protein
MSDLVPQAVRDLLAFYTENYPEIRFGDLDIRVLERAVESIDEAAKDVIAAEEAVTQARTQFRGIEAELLAKAARTLSFLKIFVDDDTAQLAKLEAISQGLPGGRRKPKGDPAAGAVEPRQRRARKSREEAATEPGTAAEQKTIVADEARHAVAGEEPSHGATPPGKKSGAKSGAK